MKKKTSKWLIPLIVVVVLAGIALYIWYRSSLGSNTSADLSKLTIAQVQSGSINTGIGATGKIRTDQTATLSWSTSGKVIKVLVKKGDKVTANQIMAQIDTASSPSLVSAQANLITAQQNLTDLENVAVNQANTQVALIQAQQAVTTAQDARNAYDVTVTQAQIDTAYATYLNDRQQVDKLQTTFDNLADRPADDLDRAQALSALDSAIQQMNHDQSNYDYLLNYTPNAQDVAKADADLALAKAQLAVAQDNWDAVKDGPDQSKVAAAQANINSIQATLDEQYIRASFAGTVTDISVQVDDMVSIGTVAFHVDNLSSLYVDLQVSEVDINNVALGQTVDLSFDAIANKQYTGTVTDIASIGTVTGGVANFTVTAVVNSPDEYIKPGMTATATIITKSASNVLLVPNRAVTTLNGEKIVYVVRNSQVTSVKVTVGLVSDTQTQVTSTDLKVGDNVVTNPSSVSTAQKSSSSSLFGSLQSAGSGSQSSTSQSGTSQPSQSTSNSTPGG